MKNLRNHIHQIDVVKFILLLFSLLIGIQGITIFHTFQLIHYIGKVILALLGAN